MADKVLRKYITGDEQRKLLAPMKESSKWESRRDFHACCLMLGTGVRVGTLVRLTVGDVRTALAAGELVFRDEISKRASGYTVGLSKRAESHLRELLSIRRELKLGLDNDAPLLVARVRSLGGEGMTTRAMQKRFKVWRERAGLQLQITPHWLRHTLGQRIVRDSSAVNPLVTAQQVLGHASLASTVIYTRPTREDMRRTLDEVSA